MPFGQIAVAGNLGSGKTTLVRGLSDQLGWERCPSKSPDRAYVTLIHAEPTRWSFEAQLNFLILKASGLRSAEQRRVPVVTDRSLYEDRDVLARSWSERYWDPPTQKTYADCAGLLTDPSLTPDVVVLCECRSEERASRRAARDTQSPVTYDTDWLRRIDELYETWRANFVAAPLLSLDTEVNDVRDPRVVRDVVRDLQRFLIGDPRSDQTVLFDVTGEASQDPLFELRDAEDAPMRALQFVNDVQPGAQNLSLNVPPARRFSVGSPSAYVAAPFTSRAIVAEPLAPDLRLPVAGQTHGTLPATYRRSLEGVARAVESKGFQAVLPHRDVNAWGQRSLTASQVASECIDLVRRCDVFVALLGESFGAHAEAGAAVALGKPCFFVEVAELGSTFIGHGFSTAGSPAISVSTVAEAGVRMRESWPWESAA